MPIRENVLQLDLFFQDGRHAKWINPSDYVCHSLSCSTLPLTDLVGWWYVPLNKIAAFYETTDCTYRHGYYTFNTGSARNHETGMHYLDSGPKRIRSVMLGRNEAALLQEAMKATAVFRHCHLEDRFEGATLDVNGTLTNNTYEIERVGDEDLAGGLSSNWSDVLPDTTANSRGLHAGGEDAPQ
ncbi:hypothetical protein JG687_00002184 [Phytophthora cactorum]|uniref:Uncharacterized protein n=1 Tax=Phytophthora cactorum TaxID=29920 RepID=A0A329SMA9_9STRA|nr:hypothetical protein Pcac1_g9149 [Phytophthora cactorum]KAG2834394.1 hypothetical protein PC111_g5839 [Phytophthora cactorum]KAG2839482.1 hypothetical protein PC112_g4111 [Phytophthora cactorum]KAG2865121.1 hypothetical protein PC113_g3983 [Phytophthora cactorum]KAG2917329.1 hypothetical protein PC114_g7189 [Phytophthora cactorum]